MHDNITVALVENVEIIFTLFQQLFDVVFW